MSNVIRIAQSIMDLTGEGLEYLVVDGEVIGKFFNGNLMAAVVVDGTDITKKAA